MEREGNRIATAYLVQELKVLAHFPSSRKETKRLQQNCIRHPLSFLSLCCTELIAPTITDSLWGISLLALGDLPSVPSTQLSALDASPVTSSLKGVAPNTLHPLMGFLGGHGLSLDSPTLARQCLWGGGGSTFPFCSLPPITMNWKKPSTLRKHPRSPWSLQVLDCFKFVSNPQGCLLPHHHQHTLKWWWWVGRGKWWLVVVVVFQAHFCGHLFFLFY